MMEDKKLPTLAEYSGFDVTWGCDGELSGFENTQIDDGKIIYWMSIPEIEDER